MQTTPAGDDPRDEIHLPKGLRNLEIFKVGNFTRKFLGIYRNYVEFMKINMKFEILNVLTGLSNIAGKSQL